MESLRLNPRISHKAGLKKGGRFIKDDNSSWIKQGSELVFLCVWVRAGSSWLPPSGWILSVWVALAVSSPPSRAMSHPRHTGLLISSSWTARVSMDRAIPRKAHSRGQAPQNMLGGPAIWPGLQCSAQPQVSNGEVLVISPDLGSIISAGNVRTALTNNVWNHFQLFAFQVSLLRSGDISRLTGGAIRGKI